MKATAPFIAGLGLVLLAPAAHACRYCQQAADPVEVMRFQGAGRKAAAGGSFPLDDSLNTYQNGAPLPAATPAAPAVVNVAAELPPTRPAPVVVPVAVTAKPPPPVAAAPRLQAPVSARWADLGLLGLAGVGVWFTWKTRSAASAV